MTPLFIIPAEVIGIFVVVLTFPTAALLAVKIPVSRRRRAAWERADRERESVAADHRAKLQSLANRIAEPPVLGGAWTPEEYVAFGHADTDDLIKRIDAELFGDQWAAETAKSNEEARARRAAERPVLAAPSRTEIRAWGHPSPLAVDDGWSKDQKGRWVQD